MRAGKRERFAPQPVRVAVEFFREKDRSGYPHCYRLAPGEYLQDLLAMHGDEQRARGDPALHDTRRGVHDRGPRIVMVPVV